MQHPSFIILVSLVKIRKVEKFIEAMQIDLVSDLVGYLSWLPIE
jgi:hypothetical protein